MVAKGNIPNIVLENNSFNNFSTKPSIDLLKKDKVISGTSLVPLPKRGKTDPVPKKKVVQ